MFSFMSPFDNIIPFKLLAWDKVYACHDTESLMPLLQMCTQSPG